MAINYKVAKNVGDQRMGVVSAAATSSAAFNANVGKSYRGGKTAKDAAKAPNDPETRERKPKRIKGSAGPAVSPYIA